LALVAARIAGQMHWAAFHRFFSRVVWDPDRLGQTLFHLLEPLLSSAWIEVAVDDTVAQKRGPRVFGASVHVDAVTSTKKRKNLIRGHCWKGIQLPIPERPWYLRKTDLSFADLVRAAQETLRGVDALDFAVAILAGDSKVFKGARGEKEAALRRGTEEQQMAKAA
jgi:DDE superfamily endonuclease